MPPRPGPCRGASTTVITGFARQNTSLSPVYQSRRTSICEFTRYTRSNEFQGVTELTTTNTETRSRARTRAVAVRYKAKRFIRWRTNKACSSNVLTPSPEVPNAAALPHLEMAWREILAGDRVPWREISRKRSFCTQWEENKHHLAAPALHTTESECMF
jgi:hypothetical protein